MLGKEMRDKPPPPPPSPPPSPPEPGMVLVGRTRKTTITKKTTSGGGGGKKVEVDDKEPEREPTPPPVPQDEPKPEKKKKTSSLPPPPLSDDDDIPMLKSLAGIGGRVAVVGVDYVNQENFEAGGVEAAYGFEKALKNEGYEGEVTTLCDDGTVNKMPTRTAVISVVDWLTRCQEHTGVVLYFSGRVSNGAVMPADHSESGGILIETLANDLEKRLPPTCTAFIIINNLEKIEEEEDSDVSSCSSGSSSLDEKKQREKKNKKKKKKNKKIGLQIDDDGEGFKKVGVLITTGVDMGEVVRVAGKNNAEKIEDEGEIIDPALKKFKEMVRVRYGGDILKPFDDGGYKTKDFATWAKKPLADVKNEVESAGLPVIRAAPLQNLAKEIFTDDILEGYDFDLAERPTPTVNTFSSLIPKNQNKGLHGASDMLWIYSPTVSASDDVRKNLRAVKKPDPITEELISLGVVPPHRSYSPPPAAQHYVGAEVSSSPLNKQQLDVRIHLHQDKAEKEVVTSLSPTRPGPGPGPGPDEFASIIRHHHTPTDPPLPPPEKIVHHVWSPAAQNPPPGQSLPDKITANPVRPLHSVITKVDTMLSAKNPQPRSLYNDNYNSTEWDGSGASGAMARVRGYIPAGGDLLGSPRFMTVPEAKKLCLETPACVGFSYPGADPAPTTQTWVYFKDKAVIYEGDWTSFIKESVPITPMAPQPPPPSSPVAAVEREAPVPSSVRVMQPTFANKKRLIDFYERYNPGKLPSVGLTLHEYLGREEELFARLISHYGPEPQPSVQNVPNGWKQVQSPYGDVFYKHADGRKQWHRPVE